MKNVIFIFLGLVLLSVLLISSKVDCKEKRYYRMHTDILCQNRCLGKHPAMLDYCDHKCTYRIRDMDREAREWKKNNKKK